MSNLTVAEEAKNYCKSHIPILKKTVWDGYTVFIHGFDEENRRAYVTEHYGTTLKYRKIIVRPDSRNKDYIQIDGTRFYLDTFIEAEEETR